MNSPYLYFLLLIFLVACSNSTQKDQPSQHNAATNESASPEKDMDIAETDTTFPLTQENHVERLTYFWEKSPERVLKIVTSKGDIEIRLHEETPIHSSTFLMLASEKYFDETLFTRVVPEFIIQGGSSDREELSMKKLMIGSFNPAPEIVPGLIHKRGAVSMARQYEDNPEKLSSPYNFFIVVGRTFNTPAIMGIERDHNKSFSAEERRIYETIGGAPHLDGEHTVFGEVVSGMDVVDEISKVETDIREWPKEDIKILTVEIVR